MERAAFRRRTGQRTKVSRNDTAFVRSATIGFLEYTSESAVSLGSGTLVSFGEVKGILTCAHVVRALRSRGDQGREVGIAICDGRSQHWALSVPMNLVDQVMLETAGDAPHGPDLAFLRLPDLFAAQLASRGSFVNGDRQRRLRHRRPKDFGHNYQGVAGVIAARTKVAVDTPRLKIYRLNGLFGRCVVERTLKHAGLDILELRHDGGRLPASFGGTSGGGLWQLYFDPKAGPTNSPETRLVGVAFWQRGKASLNAHGSYSIYTRLYGMIVSRWPAAALRPVTALRTSRRRRKDHPRRSLS